MAFPTVRARISSSRGSDATSHDVTLPVTPNSGDLIVIFYATDGSGASNWSTTSTNGGSGGPYTYQKPLADENHSGGCNSGIRYRISDGTETSPQRFTTSSSEHFVARAYVIQAGTFNATTPLEAGDDVEGSSANPNPPSLSPSWGAADTLWIAGYGADDDDESSAGPSGWGGSNFVCIESAQSTTSCSLGIADKEENIATNDPGTYTMAASEEWLAWTVAIQPSAGGTTHELATSIAGSGSLSTTLNATLALNSSIAGTGSLSSVLNETISLNTVVSGIGTLASDVTVQGLQLLETAISGIGSLASDLGITRALNTVVSGIGTIASNISSSIGLNTTVEGQGTLSSDMTIEGQEPEAGVPDTPQWHFWIFR